MIEETPLCVKLRVAMIKESNVEKFIVGAAGASKTKNINNRELE